LENKVEINDQVTDCIVTNLMLFRMSYV